MDLDLGIISESEKRLKKKLILDYLYANLKHHNFWAFRYFFCELLALINVIGMWTFRYFFCELLALINVIGRWTFRYFFCELLALINAIVA